MELVGVSEELPAFEESPVKFFCPRTSTALVESAEADDTL